MLEWLFPDINIFKIYFFMFTASASIFFFFLFKLHKVKKTTLALFATFSLFLIHSIYFSFDVLFSIRQSIFALSVLLTLYFCVKLITPKLILRYYVGIITLLAVYILFSSNLILLAGGYSPSGFKGVMSNSNTLSLYLSVFIAPLLFHFYNIEERKVYSLLLLLIIFNIAFLLFISKSRTGI